MLATQVITEIRAEALAELDFFNAQFLIHGSVTSNVMRSRHLVTLCNLADAAQRLLDGEYAAYADVEKWLGELH